jgi:hypothetical protein
MTLIGFFRRLGLAIGMAAVAFGLMSAISQDGDAKIAAVFGGLLLGFFAPAFQEGEKDR